MFYVFYVLIVNQSEHQLQGDLLITENSTDFLTLKPGHLFVKQSNSSESLYVQLFADNPNLLRPRIPWWGHMMCRPLGASWFKLFKFRPSHAQVLIYPTAVCGTCWSCQAEHQLQYTNAAVPVFGKVCRATLPPT